jgi:hypothetical protein
MTARMLTRRLDALEEAQAPPQVFRRIIIQPRTTKEEEAEMIAAVKQEAGPNVFLIINRVIPSHYSDSHGRG